ncbi:grasp-with-spasm system SPASM domain peptide maturase [Spongiimicrobium salis]|uniref:grasp-with-spasm system SPASM domain peptide maturase n=1 Tax=Spongiimicrobium salis TaxID=1667022 RepID=UPI00374DCE32
MTPYNSYLFVFTDIFFVKGYTRTMICDITKNTWEFVDNDYFELSQLFRKFKIGELLEHHVDHDSHEAFFDFVQFLIKNDYATYVDDIQNFPKIELRWISPTPIQNAIVDLNAHSVHDYYEIAKQLSELRCEHVQIRSYDDLGYKELKEILLSFSNKDFKSIHMIVKYTAHIALEAYREFIHNSPNVSFTVHSSPKNEFNPSPLENLLHGMGYVQYIKQPINSCQSCGIINKKTLRLPNKLETFIEGITHNSCLNGKISVDVHGHIKNCPSMNDSFGKIGEKSLKQVLSLSEFKKLWEINKDQIEVCKDCEYRYVCSDCRAYVDNRYAKPSKCGYNPYKGTWETPKETVHKEVKL